ncbi:cytochrome b/b6 domain-containing protein [Flavobacterium sp. NRK1]|uniref:cytochrome b/b6 domain-containing protein n=1 Tax=Flavobacterium sp. NRK1 TaxID=2954929 RepID=UPI002092F3FE|nr:cytochrome b/b6 domain-containing protein [Flavobacterium sp. NRK1]MCO6148468.1 cytochrome b/b6 domain-containing protein [Flavobacterium sp. NRK1]
MREKRFNLASRLLHWAITFTFLYILLTVFLRMGWMNKGSVGTIIHDNLAEQNVVITNDAAATIGKKVRRPMWETHIIAGYIMVGLFVLRIILTWVQGMGFANPLKKGISQYDKFKSWVYIVFYLLLGAALFTGMMKELGPRSIGHIMEDIHVQSLYFAIPFIVLHTFGVLIADAGKERGIISKIISGDRPIE